ncbi:hypothetical protein ACFSTC_37280 [Nonomuraea ferruginea]
MVAATGLSTGPFSGAAAADADALTGLLMADILDGMDDSGVFPGVIGEVGCWGAHPTPAEERALRAAARAALSSRLSVATYGQDGLAMLELLMIEGLPASRVSVGCSGADPAAARKIAESGAYVSLGSIGVGAERAAAVALDLIREGHSRAAAAQQRREPGRAARQVRRPRLRAPVRRGAAQAARGRRRGGDAERDHPRQPAALADGRVDLKLSRGLMLTS